jgi:hypothetical protein
MDQRKRELLKAIRDLEKTFNKVEQEFFAKLAREKKIKQEIAQRGGTVRRYLLHIIQAEIPEDFQKELQTNPRPGWEVHEGMLTVRL